MDSIEEATDSVDDVRTATDLAVYLKKLSEEFERRPDEYGNFSAAAFIEAAAAWIEGGGDRWHREHADAASDPWRMVAMAFWAGATYD